MEAIQEIIAILKERYPEALCALQYRRDYELMISVRLSAQCTDARVNIVTPALFERFKTVDDFAQADVSEVEEYIKSCGLYKTKAKDIVAMAKALKENFGGVVPDTIEQLVTLPGIGRKTANLVVGDIFHKSAVVVDTHCIRITSRLGFHSIKDPVKIEKILRQILPPEESNDFCHRLVLHGRAVCTARSPKCELCCMREFCPTALNAK